MGLREAMPDNSRLRSCSLGELMVTLSYVLLVIAGVLQARLNDGFAYIDEFATILLCLVSIIEVLRGTFLDKASLRVLVAMTIFVVVGVASSAFSYIPRSVSSTAIDFFTCVKFFVMFLATELVLKNGANRVVRVCSLFARVYLLLMLLFLPLSFAFDLNMVIGERLGYAFLYGHPSNFAAAVVTCLVVILANGDHVKTYTVVAAVLLFSSDRSKAIAFAAVAIAVVFMYWNRKKVPATFWMISIAGSLLIAASQIKVYFLDMNTARSVLLSSAIRVANKFFPLGAGFATYGSNVTIADYSPLYYELGFERVWGLSPVFNSYIADSFWPIIIGQFGYAGLVAFLILLGLLIKKVIDCVRAGTAPLWPAVLVVVYLLIASTSESAFFSAYAPGLSLALAMVLHSLGSEDGQVGEIA